ncbi:MAG: ATP-binding SpoIIE family protein phosphatase [Streptosporangiaceae bacterium]
MVGAIAGAADKQRAAVIAVQRAFLSPARLPPGFAARYESAAPPLDTGGDWYDVVELPDGRIGIVVGDCVGPRLDSAITMGQLGSACRALLLQDISPAETLSAMDSYAAVVPGGISSTLFCGVLDPRTGELVYSSAGHPPPIVAQPDGEIRLLDEGRSPALAVQPVTGRRDARWWLRSRATLLLYTNGLVERSRARLEAGIARAAAVLGAGRPEPVRDLAGRLMAELAPAGGYEDDVALLLYRSPGPLELTFPAGPEGLAPVRSALRAWLARCDLTERTAQDVLIAAGEAVANAYEHGSGGASGRPISVTATATGSDLHLTVTDAGRWKESAPVPGAYRGHGLPLMRALMSEVTVTPGPAGTTVRMRLRITP